MIRINPPSKSILKRLKKSPYFILVGVLIFTIVQPSYLMAIFNAFNPPKVAPLHSEKVLPAQSKSVGSFASVLIDDPDDTVKRTAERYADTDKEGLPEGVKRVRELTNLRTKNTSTYLNSDGTRTMEYSTIQQNYKEGGQWKKINNKLESFKHAGKSAFRGKAGRSSADLRSLNSGISLGVDGKSIAIKPHGVGNVKPEKLDDTTVIYRDVWPHVDLKYQLVGGMIKEFTVIKDKAAQTTFDYVVTGGKVIVDPSNDKALAIQGIDSYHFSPLTLDVNERGIISEERVAQSPTANGLRVSLDGAWFKEQPDSAFPMVIDPSWTSSDPNTTYKMYKSNGYYCPPTSCYANIGTLNDGGVESLAHLYKVSILRFG